jgi:hypothetical protein
MSEYCYQCLSCGEFREDCKCPKFEDPMAPYKNRSIEELFEENDKRKRN